jgi:hypothetical protein
VPRPRLARREAAEWLGLSCDRAYYLLRAGRLPERAFRIGTR